MLAHPNNRARVRQMAAVRFLIGKVWQRMSGMGRWNGDWVKVWELGIGRASVYRALQA